VISAGGSGIHRPIKRASKKCQESLVTPGTEYQAKKAEGDVKKKGKPDWYISSPLTQSA
jgi:ribosomal RNA-processing protein 12